MSDGTQAAGGAVETEAADQSLEHLQERKQDAPKDQTQPEPGLWSAEIATPLVGLKPQAPQTLDELVQVSGCLPCDVPVPAKPGFCLDVAERGSSLCRT